MGRVYFLTLTQFPVHIHLQCTFQSFALLNRDLKNQSFLKNYLKLPSSFLGSQFDVGRILQSEGSANVRDGQAA